MLVVRWRGISCPLFPECDLPNKTCHPVYTYTCSTTVATCDAGYTYPSAASETTTGFDGVCVAQCLVLCIVSLWSSFLSGIFSTYKFGYPFDIYIFSLYNQQLTIMCVCLFGRTFNNWSHWNSILKTRIKQTIGTSTLVRMGIDKIHNSCCSICGINV